MVQKRWTYFEESEVEGLDHEFVALLDKARHIAGVPFIITSGLRTLQANQSLTGAAKDSAHLRGLAVDLRVRTSNEVFRIIQAAIAMGICRIGVYVAPDMTFRHLHLDSDKTLPQEVMWMKQEAN